MSTEKKKILGVLPATAICGNDISSSVLYVSALSIAYAGQYAWITLLIVSVVLFLFRKIYGEVVGSLPLNGGAYNALLNTTSKSTASLAATLTLLSYMATAVISANEAIHYLHHLVDIPIIFTTVLLLLFFAVLAIMGISESAKVATGIFIFHLTTLAILTVSILMYLNNIGFDQLIMNWNTPLKGSITVAIFFGFSVSMLGISGFESSANFVEEQKDGVFPKTLKNMWIIVSIINPLMAFLALSVVPMQEIQTEYKTTLLSHMGEISSGEWLSIIISIDAFLVLSGAVLTSFVGVTGLLQRMTLDRILPQFLLKKNKKGSSYLIIILFFILSLSVLLITQGEVGLLAGLYTISFLSVMVLFGFGNILLKVKRAKLPRPERASWIAVLLAIIAVLVALAGNIIKPEEAGQPKSFMVFLQYFIPAIILIWVMLNRIQILKVYLTVTRYIFSYIQNKFNKAINKTNTLIDEINSQQFVFFTNKDDLSTLNKVILYILNNEHTKHFKLVHVIENDSKEEKALVETLKKEVEFLDKEYPQVKLECVFIEAKFEPALIQKLSKKWKIPVNFMFIASPGDHFPYKVEELGGVRLII